MSKKPEKKNKGGRPKKEIPQDEFEKLCQIQCTQAEICDWFGIDDVTLNSWCKETYKECFSEIFRQKRGKGKISLRRKGYQMAHEVPAVWIFHAKNFLGMRDSPIEITQKIEDNRKGLSPETVDEMKKQILGIEDKGKE